VGCVSSVSDQVVARGSCFFASVDPPVFATFFSDNPFPQVGLFFSYSLSPALLALITPFFLHPSLLFLPQPKATRKFHPSVSLFSFFLYGVFLALPSDDSVSLRVRGITTVVSLSCARN